MHSVVYEHSFSHSRKPKCRFVFVFEHFCFVLGMRCCRAHLEGRLFTADALSLLHNRHSPGSVFFSDILALTKLYFKSDHTGACSCNTIDFDSLAAEQYHALTGLRRSDFDDLLSQVLFKGKKWTPRNALGVYLMKLRLGEQHSRTYCFTHFPVTLVNYRLDTFI